MPDEKPRREIRIPLPDLSKVRAVPAAVRRKISEADRDHPRLVWWVFVIVTAALIQFVKVILQHR